MRIAFTGSHGVGKSTLLLDPRMAEILKVVDSHYEHWHYKLWDGIGRGVHTRHPDWSPEAKQRYFNWWYVTHHYLTKSFMASRSIYDTWAYSRLTVSPWYQRSMMDWAARHVWYDFVFYVPVEFPLEQDGIRYSDPAFQHLVDVETKRILDFYYIPYHTITGTVDERIDQIRTILGA